MTERRVRRRRRRPQPLPPIATPALTPSERLLLEEILHVQSSFGQQDLMRQHAAGLATEAGAAVHIENGNLYAVKGEAARYPCFVAHLDTVHDLLPEDAYLVVHDSDAGRYSAIDRRTGQPTGVGGDDKAGIFIALALLKELPACKIALFRDEEAGCQGADVADLTFFTDCAFVFECDRPGTGAVDFVTVVRRRARRVALADLDFRVSIRPIMRRHGFRSAVGKGTDVTTLRLRGLTVPCANVACGYHLEHTAEEYVDESEVAAALALCRDIAARIDGLRGARTSSPSSTIRV